MLVQEKKLRANWLLKTYWDRYKEIWLQTLEQGRVDKAQLIKESINLPNSVITEVLTRGTDKRITNIINYFSKKNILSTVKAIKIETGRSN